MSDQAKRWASLLAIVLATSAVWGGALPLLAEWPPIREHLDCLEQADVDAGAMFYTELSPRIWD